MEFPFRLSARDLLDPEAGPDAWRGDLVAGSQPVISVVKCGCRLDGDVGPSSGALKCQRDKSTFEPTGGHDHCKFILPNSFQCTIIYSHCHAPSTIKAK